MSSYFPTTFGNSDAGDASVKSTSFTGTLTAGSSVITSVSSTVGLKAGMLVYGPFGLSNYTPAEIVTVGNGVLTVKETADFTFSGTYANSATTLTSSFPVNTLAIGMVIAGLGIPDGTTITNISGTTVTISAATTQAQTNYALTVTGSLTSVTFTFFNEQDALLAYTVPSKLPTSAGNGNLGPYAVSLTSASHGSRQFTVDTSFEPYRREAFRHRTIPSQRQSIMMTNISGQGTVNTEGLWRREQTEWSMGAGQQYLDRKSDSQETRFYQSKGVDVFSFPLQATLLPDTYRKDSIGSVNSNLMMSRCGNYVVYVNGASISYVTAQRSWGSATLCTFDGTVNRTVSGVDNTTPTVIKSLTTNDTYVFVATNTGIWFCQIGASSVFTLYMANDVTNDATGNFTGGYDMVRWTNDQIVCSRKNRLYAIQNRVASPGYPAYGSIPSIADTSISLNTITVSSTTATVTTEKPHNLSAGQPISISGSLTNVPVSTISSASGVATVTTTSNHGLSIGQDVSITGNTHASFNGTTTVKGVSSNTVFTYNTNESATVSSGATGGNAEGSGLYGFNTNWVVLATPSTTTFTMTVPSSYAANATSGTVLSSQIPDMLYTHQNTQWVWSDATGGETQVYFAGYISASDQKYGGCIYRSNLMGSSTTTTQGFTSISNSSTTQPFNLNVPVQALPMSPDEYPVCLESYLNYIFIGTNRGIRMTQTLSIYDPTATATGDLKSGPLIPNVLQPVTYPVTSIVGDGRYVWFAWNNYDDQSTGLGKLDLSTFITGDPLSPAYASDIMVTGQGTINSLDWDPYDNVPLMAVGGLGVYAPSATNEGGNPIVFKYVPEGNIVSGIFDYGIPDKKVPVYFDYGAIAPASKGTGLQAFIDIDPNDEDAAGYQTLPSYPQNGDTAQTEFPVPNYHAEQFGVNMVLYSDYPNCGYTPVLHRWTLKAWPAAVSGTAIMAVFQLWSVSVVDGMEIFTDPYDNFIWLENRRQNQEILTYQEGPLSVTCVIEALDWLPHNRRDNYENGFEGDCVVTLKTISPYTYTPAQQL